MSFPTGLLRYAGVWTSAAVYEYGMFVVASNNSAYGCGVTTSTGVDPATQPSTDWFPYPSVAPGSGTITGVTPGTGISGGGTSGNVTVTNDGVLDLTQGSNITITGTKANYTIAASGVAAGVSSLNSATGAVVLTMQGGMGSITGAGGGTLDINPWTPAVGTALSATTVAQNLPGSIAWEGSGTSTKAYNAGAMVIYSGVTYVCLVGQSVGSVPPANGPNWQSIGGGGGGSSITAGGATVACDDPAATGSITLTTTATGSRGDVTIDTTGSSGGGDVTIRTGQSVVLDASADAGAGLDIKTTLTSSYFESQNTGGVSGSIIFNSADPLQPAKVTIGGTPATTGLYVSNSQLRFNNVAVATITPFNYNYYVSNVSGSDSTGTGTITNPWKTIGKAMVEANTIPDTNQVSIILAAGTYVEAVSFTRANTFISGSATSNSTATIINGQMNIDLTASTLPFVIGGISSVQLLNVVYTNTVAKSQSFLITDCLIAPGVGVNAMNLSDTSVGGTGDVTVQSCIIYQSDVIAIVNSNVFMNFVNVDIKNNPSPLIPPSATSMIQTSGNGRLYMYGCLVTQNNASATVNPLIDLANTTTTSGMTFYNSSLVYTSATVDTGGGKCCIRCSNAAALAGITVFNNLMICEGARTTNGTPGQYVVLQKTGAGTVAVTQGQNSGGATANHFPANGGGFTKTALVAIA